MKTIQNLLGFMPRKPIKGISRAEFVSPGGGEGLHPGGGTGGIEVKETGGIEGAGFG